MNEAQKVIAANPNLRDLLNEQVVQPFQMAAVKAGLALRQPSQFPLPKEKDSFEQIFTRYLAKSPLSYRNSARTNALAISALPQATLANRLGVASGVDLTSKTSVEKQAAGLFVALSSGTKNKIAAEVSAIYPRRSVAAGGTVGTDAGIGGPTAKKLNFRIHEVKCNDETGSPYWDENFGMDEIDMGATTIDAVGTTGTVPPFRVAKFNDGTVKKYAKPKVLETFDLTKGRDWPKGYTVLLSLAEKDKGGGFPDFINKIEEAAKAKLAALLGAWIGSSGGPVGALIGLAVGYVVGEIFDWLEGFLADDIFDPIVIVLNRHYAAEPLPGGAAESAKMAVIFSGHSGKYTVVYDWQLMA